MTDNDIIEGLRCCNDGLCEMCPYHEDEFIADCREQNGNDALDLINRQKAEIERLIDLINEIGEYNEAWVADNHDLRVELKRADEEIERKDRILESYALQYGTATDKEVFLRKAKADAIREFAERFRERCGRNCDSAIIWAKGTIDNLVREMTEETK